MNHHPQVRIDSARARVLVRIKAARGMHAAIRASGRVCGQEARAARSRYAAERRAAKARAAAGLGASTTLPDGTY